MSVKVTSLVKRYGNLNAIDHFNLQVNNGEMAGLFGPDGAGKTTALLGILQLIPCNKGQVELFGCSAAHGSWAAIKEKIGYVPQDIAVYQELTVYENVEYFCGLYVKEKERRIGLSEEAVEFMGLRDFRKFYPHQLNMSLLKKLNMACGIAQKPELLILDEPVSDVDIINSRMIREKIIELNQRGTGIIYTTHDAEDVEALSGKIYMLDQGRTIASGTKEQLKEMIGIQEKITLEAYHLPEEVLKELKELPNVCDVNYHSNQLALRSQKGKHNLINILNFLQERNVSIGSVYSERPTLNDVYLEMTGRELFYHEDI